jgi:glycosyltransferase involved in cell wall biosynthesis
MGGLKSLHLLYTGCEKGGAQKVAIECANYNHDLCTSTVKTGGFLPLLQKKSLKTLEFYKLIFSNKFDIIYCSDPRALLFSFFAFRSILSKKYLILHSDRWIKNKIILMLFCKFFSINYICTTKTQFDIFKKYSKDISLVRIVDIPKVKPAHQQDYGLLYFGRLDPIKNIQIILDVFSNLRYKDDRFKLTIVGMGSQLIEDVKGVSVIREWKSQNELEEIMKNSSFIVNATDYEGFSLQLMEGISNGLFPLVGSNGLAVNYNLPKECFLNVDNIVEVVHLTNDKWQNVISKLQASLVEYLESTTHLKEFIRDEIKD